LFIDSWFTNKQYLACCGRSVPNLGVRIKKTPIKTLEENLWELVKEFVFLRDKYCCQKCGRQLSPKQCQPSHVIPKARSKYLRFDPNNIKTLCYYDHIYWWHKNPLEATGWFENRFPDRYKYVMENKNRVAKFRRPDYEEKINAMKKLIDRTKNLLKK